MEILKKLILSCITVAAIGLGLASAVTTAEAHHYVYPNATFGYLFGSSGYDQGYHGNGYYENGLDDYGYNNGHYSGYHYFRRHVSHRCHVGTVRYHQRIHHARICNGRVTKVY